MKCRVVRVLFVTFLIMGTIGCPAAAQQLPSFDIYLVGMRDGQVDTTAYAVRNISNRPGFDNHPAFSQEGSAVMYVSDRPGSSIALYRFNINRRNNLQMTFSSSNIFYPKPLPVRGYSAIIDDNDGKLRLWNLSADAMSRDLVLADVTSIGNYEWIDDNRLALFVLGESTTLQIVEVKSGKRTVVESNIGRTLSQIPGTTDVSFVHKMSDENWAIKKVNPDTGLITEIAPTYGNGEDFAWTSDGTLLMGSDTTIYEWVPSRKSWRKFYDFSDYGVGSITRLAVSPVNSFLAFVTNR